jgi:hypothetical protein
VGKLQPAASFSQAYGLHYALQLVIQRALREGEPIAPDSLTAMLIAEFPDCGMTAAEVRDTILEATATAQLPTATA